MPITASLSERGAETSVDRQGMNDAWVRTLKTAIGRNRLILGFRRTRRWVGQTIRSRV